jgi:hypothetical protein
MSEFNIAKGRDLQPVTSQAALLPGWQSVAAATRYLCRNHIEPVDAQHVIPNTLPTGDPCLSRGLPGNLTTKNFTPLNATWTVFWGGFHRVVAHQLFVVTWRQLLLWVAATLVMSSAHPATLDA